MNPKQTRFHLFILIACVMALSGLAAATSTISAANKPIIGINMDVSETTRSKSYRLGGSYVDAIALAGGIPVLLPAIDGPEDIRRQVELCDGFVMTGGRDITPSRYGEEPHPTYNPLDPVRENYDFALIEAILEARKPILGVCLGGQELFVATGGSLVQDIPSQTSSTITHRQEEIRSEPSHEIHFTTGTRLADALGTTTLAVNSFHHQACKVPGPGVLITAKAPDGVIESYEVQNQPFAVGIQWHPEGMTSEPLQLKVYETLVEEAAKAKGNRSK